MAETATGSDVLLSVKPRFARRILSGEKNVEFRKTSFRRPVSGIYIYATKPVQKVVAFVEINNIVEQPPELLWDRYQSDAGITEEQFFDYYEGKKKGVALIMGKVNELSFPKKLEEILGNSTPPQNFCYIPG